MTIQPGSLIGLCQKPGSAYQVVNHDDYSDSVWVRRWPVGRHRTPTFQVDRSEITPLTTEATQ